MKIREGKVMALRIALKESEFYEDIIFVNEFVSEKVKNILAEWIFKLQEYKHIEIKKFKELFNELDEIVFPIIIKEAYVGRCRFDIEFIEARRNKYYIFKRNIYDYHDMQKFIIGRRNSSLEPLVDREFYYQICEDKTIKLIKTCALQLNQDGKNKDIVVDFCFNYDEHKTEATLWSYSSKNKIRIKYPTMSDEFDKKVLKFLFDNESKLYYYDVFSILKWIVTAISDERASISVVAEIDEEIVSEIDVVNGIVQKYTVTKIINEGEMHIIKKIFAKELRKFLAEKN